MPISRADVEHVARLARLDLAPGEIDGLARDLGSILDYAACLESLDTDAIDPVRDEGGDPRLRKDVVEPGLEPGEATRDAPQAENGLFKVPPAFTEE
jgi:aspartyl-tRNA(Asn)/glutamyl-tRNA(Gln) amidotransferase subunit C